MESDGPSPATITMDAFFAEHYRPLVWFVFRRTRDYGLAEEIAVDCLVLAWRRARPESITKGWLFGTARNRIGDALRKRDRDRNLLTTLSQELLHSGENYTPGHVGDALEHLPSRDRDLLKLIYWDALTPAEIAELEGTSVTNIWKRSSRAHARLRGLLTVPSRITAKKESGLGYALD